MRGYPDIERSVYIAKLNCKRIEFNYRMKRLETKQEALTKQVKEVRNMVNQWREIK